MKLWMKGLLAVLLALALFLVWSWVGYTRAEQEALAIIGGADGPTSVIVGVPRTEKKLHVACSALTFEPQKKVEWKMTFREKTVVDISVILIYKENI